MRALAAPRASPLQAGRLFHEYRQCHTVMTKSLSPKDIIALGFMTFALFVGAGNIIFPPLRCV